MDGVALEDFKPKPNHIAARSHIQYDKGALSITFRVLGKKKINLYFKKYLLSTLINNVINCM